MDDEPTTGEIIGIPYNFERPSISRMLSAYWQPGESMLVHKPFGIGYTLNLANWRSWIVLAIAGALAWQERQRSETTPRVEDEGPIEVIVEEPED